MHRNLQTDLAHLSTLAFRRLAHCGPLLEKFYALAPQIGACVVYDSPTDSKLTHEQWLIWGDDSPLWRPARF